MNLLFNSHRNVINFGVPILLLGILIFVMSSSLFVKDDALNFAITIDLLLTVPLVYFLLIRKSNIPKTTIIPLMIIGLLIGSYFLPKESQSYLIIFKTWILPVVELSVLALVVIKVRGTRKRFKELNNLTPDFFTTLKSTCYEILPKKLVLPFATEVAVFYYGFVNWKKRVINENEFTYHKKSGTPALFGAFILIIVIETFTLHLLLTRWSSNAAWVLTALSVYSAIQVLGFVKSLSKRPISINQNSLTLKYGILNETEIILTDIRIVELSGKSLDKDQMEKTLSPLGDLEAHNVIIYLKNENELIGIYGVKRKFKMIGFHIDEPIDFKVKLENAIKLVA